MLFYSGSNQKLIIFIKCFFFKFFSSNYRELDHEEKRDHEIILTLTDGHLGEGRYITQSLLILVEDANDNPPVFSPPQISVEVAEHVSNLVLATLSASDLDSGAFGQVREPSKLFICISLYLSETSEWFENYIIF